MSKSKFLALDFGAESGRAIVGILDNNKIELNEVHRFPNRIIDVFGSKHWDILYLFDELKKGIKKAVIEGHEDIEGIAVDTWGVDFGFITKDNQLLGFPYSYRDSRTIGMLEKAFTKMPKEEIYNYTGTQFLQINSVYQLLSMVEDKNLLLESADKLLFMPDLFNFLLTGKKKSEYTIASTSQLLNPSKKKWEEKIFNSLGLPRKLMCDLVFPGDKIGALHKSIIQETGIKKTCVYAVGNHDTASAVAAVPNLNDNWAFISSGTWSLIGIENTEPIINEKSMENDFTNEGGVEGKIRFLRNVMGMWIIQQLKKEWEAVGIDYSYSVLQELANKAEPFKCFIDTDHPSFLDPKSMIDSINEFCHSTSQKLPTTKGEYIRSVLESLAFKYRLIIDKINIFRGKKIETLNIVGGGSRNELLNQFTANAVGVNVYAGPVEATAFGNIIVQAIAAGRVENLVAGRKIIANSEKLNLYKPKQTEIWDERFKEVVNYIS